MIGEIAPSKIKEIGSLDAHKGHIQVVKFNNL
jgi:hypothetical protein